MNIAVCVKQVPATDSRIKPTAHQDDIDRTDMVYVVNPYDEFGVEEALKIKDRVKTGSVTAITIGPEKASEVLRSCLALGVDQAIHLKDPALAGGDAYSTAVVLSAVLKKGNLQGAAPYDIIFFGKHAVDTDNGAVAIHVAEFLGLPHVGVINQLTLDPDGEKRAIAHRQIEDAIEVVETSLPAIFTCQKGLNEPRYATLAGIMKAKQKPLTVLTLNELGLTESQVGSKGAKLVVERLELPQIRKAGVMLEGDPDIAVAELVRLLHEEAKVL